MLKNCLSVAVLAGVITCGIMGFAFTFEQNIRVSPDSSIEMERIQQSQVSEIVINFDKDKVNEPPKGFTTDLSGKGEPGKWIIVRDETAPSNPHILAQMDMDRTSRRFPICIYDSIKATDADISVRFKPMKGKVDQGAGIVWRFIDKGNYYIVRANALEDNVVLYKFEKGKRTDIDPSGPENLSYGMKAPVENAEWGTLRVVVKGNQFDVYLNGNKLYEVIDETFKSAGRIGLWTKADSYTLFDDLSVKILK